MGFFDEFAKRLKNKHINYNMNKIWLYLVIFSCLTLIFTAPEKTTDAMINSAISTVELGLELLAIYSVWLGLLEILEETGLSEKLTKLLTPLVKKLFKTNNKDAIKQISISISANLLGLGNAATPSAMKAMEILDDKSGKPNFPMTMLMVISACSIQLLPTTIIGLMSKAGSTNPSRIIFPILVVSFATLIFGISMVFVLEKLKKVFIFKKLKKRIKTNWALMLFRF